MSSSKKIRWGILGVAKINDRLMPSFHRLSNGELVGIASRSLDRAQEAAKKDGIPKAYGSYQALLDDPAIDAVYNPLPNSMHAEWTKKAAQRGKHVLCEKPLCASAAEAAELVAFCRGQKICLMDGFMWPHHPRTKRMRELLDKGEIGPIRRATGAFTFRMPELDTKNIRLQPNLGGGSLLDVGCYPIYGIRWAMGAEPVRVSATAHYLNDCDVEVTGTLWFADGRMASFDCGFTHPMRQWLEIIGTTGTIFVDEMWVPATGYAAFQIRREGRPAGDLEEHVLEGQEQIQHMLENFGSYVLDGRPATPSPDEAVKTLKVLDALAKSARDGKVVDVA
jgi:xylose dehydrogenase (NAD/NADP)